jgi:hypothetical protein
MPGLNRTGPWGEGPRTGRGLGLCNPRSGGLAARFAWGSGRGRGFGRGGGLGRGFGPGMGWGRGYGRGFGWWRFGVPRGAGYAQAYGSAPLAPTEEIDMLRAEADSLKSSLAEINKRIEELQSKSAE